MPKRCEYENCNKKPYFNLEGELAPRFCSEHKDIGMVNVKKQKQCEKCTKQPNFNFYGEHVPRFCNEHRDHGMVNVKKAKQIHAPFLSFHWPRRTKGVYPNKRFISDFVKMRGAP
jgi:hypothetical protein